LPNTALTGAEGEKLPEEVALPDASHLGQSLDAEAITKWLIRISEEMPPVDRLPESGSML
jgi:hypothetical protein